MPSVSVLLVALGAACHEQVRQHVVLDPQHDGSNGEQDDEVTLDAAAPSGVIQHLGGQYDYVGIAANTVTPPGFYIADTTYLLSDANDILAFEAGKY